MRGFLASNVLTIGIMYTRIATTFHAKEVAMKAYVYGANGAEITDVAKPSPKGTQVLVKVHD